MKIPRPHIDSLRAAGLLVSEGYGPNHRAYPDGASICKPASVLGNHIDGFESWSDKTLVDAPSVRLHAERGQWVVTAQDFVPGPGAGDFINEWPSVEDAVADILDFYFGDCKRMDAKRVAQSSA